MSAVYDYEPSPRNDPMVSIIDKYLQTALLGLAPGKILLVKLFPFCGCLWLNRASDFTHMIWESTPYAPLASGILDPS